MKVSIFTPNISANCAGRAWVLGKLLENEFEIEIVGPSRNLEVWPPLANEKNVRFLPVKAHSGLFSFRKQADELRHAATGDAIYVSKPIYSIMFPAILEKQEKNKPFLLDIDDWQMGFQCRKLAGPIGLCRVLSKELFCACNPDSFWNALAGEAKIEMADSISVSNSFLQKKYGGTLIPHARDGSFLNPGHFATGVSKESLDIPEKAHVVAFIGSPRPHKGLEDLIEAVDRLLNRDILLLVVGLGNDTYSETVRKLGSERLGTKFIPYGIQPYSELPRFLSAADVIVIPQRKSSASQGQTPAKVFDAMAMGKPIIATAIGDLPEILEGCGYLVPPNDTSALAKMIGHVINDKNEANWKAGRARNKFLDVYDFQTVGRTICQMFHDVLAKA